MSFTRVSVALLLLVLLTGCGPQLRTVPEHATLDLSGDWQLSEGEHQQLIAQLRTAIEQANAKDDARERQHRRRDMPDSDSPSPESGPIASGRNWQLRDRSEQLEMMLAVVVPAQSLRITQRAPDALEIQSGTGPVRQLDTQDGSTLVNKFATLRIRSGWQGSTFLIYSRDSSQGLTITESYRRVANQLLVQVQFEMSGLKQQTLNAHYQLQPH